MPRNAHDATPNYRKHKASGQAIVTLTGRDHYLGPHGTRATRLAYDRLVSEWIANGRRTPTARHEASVMELMAAYVRHSKEYYRGSSEYDATLSSLQPLKALYGTLPVEEFSPLKLKAVREKMIETDLCRNEVNKRIGRIKRMFRWGVENEIVLAEVWHGLQAVRGLCRGRSEARETEPIKPVPEAFVDAVKPKLSPQIWAMIELQRYTGMRPGEVCQMRTTDIGNQILLGDCLTLMNSMQHRSVRLVITSPPPYPGKLGRYGGKGKLNDEEWVAWMLLRLVAKLRVCDGLVGIVANSRVSEGAYRPAVRRIEKTGSAMTTNTCFSSATRTANGSGTGKQLQRHPSTLPEAVFASGHLMAPRRLGNEYPKNKLARPRDVLRVTVGGGHLGSKLAHDNEAPFPEALVEPFVLALTIPGDLVLDPFCGSGTTLKVAAKHGRGYIGIDDRHRRSAEPGGVVGPQNFGN